MSTIVYLIRHSKCFKDIVDTDSNLSSQSQNERIILSQEGENLAKELSELSELSGIDIIYSSNYIRAIGTAKYIADKNNKVINVLSGLGERKIGLIKPDTPCNYFEMQNKNLDYKLDDGESINDVKLRMKECVNQIINNNKNKKIAIISHGTAIASYLLNYCDVSVTDYKSKKRKIIFNNQIVFEGVVVPTSMFKLVFDDMLNLISIDKI